VAPHERLVAVILCLVRAYERLFAPFPPLLQRPLCLLPRILELELIEPGGGAAAYGNALVSARLVSLPRRLW
jgi:hypothetical protein